MTFKVSIGWGGTEQPLWFTTHSFDTQAELDAYLMGVHDCDGWMDYKIVDRNELVDDITNLIVKLDFPVDLTRRWVDITNMLTGLTHVDEAFTLLADLKSRAEKEGLL